MSRARWGWILLAAAVVLSIPSQHLYLTFAGAEPLFSFDRGAVFQWVAGGAVLAVLWVQWCALAVVLIATKRIPWIWAVGVLWGFANVYYAADTSVGSLVDLERFAFDRGVATEPGGPR